MSKAWGSWWRSGVLLALILAVSTAGFLAWRAQGPETTRVIAVHEVAATGCGTFGNQTCHLVATTEGEVLTVHDDSWVVMEPQHCYQVTVRRIDGEIYGAREVSCPTNVSATAG